MQQAATSTAEAYVNVSYSSFSLGSTANLTQLHFYEIFSP